MSSADPALGATPVVEAALSLAKAGWAIIPLYNVRAGGACECQAGTACTKPAKHPRIKQWQTLASTDPAQIRSWFAQWPNANVGHVTGRPGRMDVLLDVDPRHGGDATLARLEAQYGVLPVGPRVRSGSGGAHYYFSVTQEQLGELIAVSGNNTGNSSSVLGSGLDIKAVKGQGVLPPSLHACGDNYQWQEGFGPEVPLASLPGWILGVVRANGSNQSSSSATATSPKVRDQIGVAEGGRHDALHRYVSSLRGGNVAYDDAVDRAGDRNATYSPPLDAAEVTVLVDDVYQRYEPNPKTYEPGDFGNAAYLADQLEHQVLYDWSERRYLVWNGNIWVPDTDGAMTRLWEREARERIVAAAQLAAIDPRKAEPESKAGFAMLGSRYKMTAALEIAASNEKLKDDGTSFDRDPYLFGFPNGIYNLRTKAFRAGRPEDRVTKVVAYNYDPSATCPLMDKALDEIFCGDRDLIDAFWVHVGYMATGDVSERVIIFAYGEGANGKNVVFRVVRAAFGPYAMTANASLLQQFDSRQKQISNEIRDLKGMRLALIDEWPGNAPLGAEALKKLHGGGEEIRARNLHEKDVEFVPTHHIVVRCNDRPIVKDESEASWDRIILWPFDARFDNDDPAARPRNVHLFEEIVATELPGIFNRIADGAARWVPGHLPRPAAVKAATLDYRAEHDPVLAWMRDPAFVVLDPSARTPFDALYASFKRHWHSQGSANLIKEPMSKKKFGQQLQLPTRGLKVAPGGTRAYVGIGVVVPAVATVVRDDDGDEKPPTDEEAAALVAMFN